MNDDLILEEKVSKKYRHWLILLYEDSTSYDFKEVMKIIKAQKYYAYIKHDPESNEKKSHFHVILSFDNATKKTTLANKLGIQENYIDEVKNFRVICRYLTHIDDEEKIQYNIENVKISRPFERKFYKCYDDIENEEDMINNIYLFIDKLNDQNNNYYENVRLMVTYVNSHCYDIIYKRYRNEFLEYLKQGIKC